MRLIRKSGLRSYCCQRFVSRLDSNKRFSGACLGAEGGRRDAEHSVKASRKRLCSKALPTCPVAQTELRIFDQIGCEHVRPVEGRLRDGNQLFVKMHQGRCTIGLGHPGDGVGILQSACAARERALRFWNNEVQNSRTFRAETIQMGLEPAMNYNIAGANAKTSETAALFVKSGQDDGRIGLIVAVARNLRIAAPAFMPVGYTGEACHPASAGNDGRQ